MTAERYSRKSGWEWIEGIVDTDEDHFRLTYGSVERKDDLVLVALVGRGEGRTFMVQFLPLDEFAEHSKMLEQVKSELDLYLVEKRVGEPWNYAIYHCGTASNLYSPVHWGYYPKGWTENPQQGSLEKNGPS